MTEESRTDARANASEAIQASYDAALEDATRAAYTAADESVANAMYNFA